MKGKIIINFFRTVLTFGDNVTLCVPTWWNDPSRVMGHQMMSPLH
jgi:hypothetical protein